MRQHRFVQFCCLLWPLGVGLGNTMDDSSFPMGVGDLSGRTTRDYARPDSQIDFHQVITNCLLCETNSFILLSDANAYVDSVTNYLTNHSIIFTHWDQRHMSFAREEVEKHLTKTYALFPHTTFVLLLHQPTQFLNIVDVIAERRGRGQLSMMRHKTQWLVVVWSEEQMVQLETQQRGSILDNVAVIRISSERLWFITIDKMATFMWRANRTRESQRVDSYFLEGNCVVFPNKMFGMNGRNIKVAVKPFFETLLTARQNLTTKAWDYHGKAIDLLSMMADKLNFSYVIWPSAGRQVFRRWEDYGKVISNGSYDIGLNVWSLLYGELGPYSVTYPINFDVITGVYRSPEESERETSIFLLFPFPRMIYLFLGVAVVGTAVLYITTRHSHLGNKSYKQQQQDRGGSQRKLTFHSFLDIMGDLLASVINQNYLPNPSNMSSRLLLGCWSLTIVILYALDTGYITASMVKQEVHPPFQTFEQLASRDDYYTGTIENSIVSRVMNESQPGVLGDLGGSVRRIVVDETSTARQIVASSMSSADDKFVLVYYEMAIREWLERQDDAKRFTIMDSYLIESSAGLLLHKDSDLASLLSHQIMRMHETGLLSEDHRRGGSRRIDKSVADAKEISKKSLKLVDFFWPFVWVVFMLVLAVAVLALEFITAKCKLTGIYRLKF